MLYGWRNWVLLYKFLAPVPLSCSLIIIWHPLYHQILNGKFHSMCSSSKKKVSFFLHLFLEGVYVCVSPQVKEVNSQESILFLYHKFQGLNSCFQSWQQLPLPTEPSCQLHICSTFKVIFTIWKQQLTRRLRNTHQKTNENK